MHILHAIMPDHVPEEKILILIITILITVSVPPFTPLLRLHTTRLQQRATATYDQLTSFYRGG